MENEEFERLVWEGIGEIPDSFLKKIRNVAFVIEDEPSKSQREKIKLDKHHTLLGLYEGIPQTRRGVNYYMVLPDKITIFKKPILAAAKNDPERVRQEVADTVWHEVGHHFGLNEVEVRKRQQERSRLDDRGKE
jgi:predicted Zn-dependent protease with MMP-like domain